MVDRADGASGRPVRQGSDERGAPDRTTLSTLSATDSRLLLALAAPFVGLYPVFLMKVLCFALFACAFNLLIGYTGLLSFGHAAFFGGAGYVTRLGRARRSGCRPNSASCWAPRPRRCSASSSACSRSAARASTSR